MFHSRWAFLDTRLVCTRFSTTHQRVVDLNPTTRWRVVLTGTHFIGFPSIGLPFVVSTWISCALCLPV